MGVWSEGPFENEVAAEWSASFNGIDLALGLRLIHEALAQVLRGDAPPGVDAEAGQLAVAAAEVVAAMRGWRIQRSAYNEEVCDWVAREVSGSDPAMEALAQQALERVLAPGSELAEWWDDALRTTWRCAVLRRLITLDSPNLSPHEQGSS